MAVQTLPVNIDLTVYTGTTFRRLFRWLPEGTVGQDFTSWSGLFRLGPNRGAALWTGTTGTGGVHLTADGVITVTITPAETDTLPAGTLFYVLDLTDPNGLVMRLLRGRLSVVRDVG